VTGEDFHSDYPPRLGRARLFVPLNHVFVKENPPGATIEEVTTLALESTV